MECMHGHEVELSRTHQGQGGELNKILILGQLLLEWSELATMSCILSIIWNIEVPYPN
jgi:hypothetical protein